MKNIKLPSHISTHELLTEAGSLDAVLVNSITGMCWAINSNNDNDISIGLCAVEKSGWKRDSDVGREIKIEWLS